MCRKKIADVEGGTAIAGTKRAPEEAGARTDSKRVKLEAGIKSEGHGADVVVKEEHNAGAAAAGEGQTADDARSVTAELMAGLRRKTGGEGVADVSVGATAPAEKKEVFVLDAGEELRIEVVLPRSCRR